MNRVKIISCLHPIGTSHHLKTTNAEILQDDPENAPVNPSFIKDMTSRV